MTGVSLFDWEIYRHLFSGAAMERLFDERATLACLVDVERAVSRAQGAVGIIPADAAQAIDAALDPEALDLERLRADTRDVGRPIAGLVAQLMEQAGDAGRWVHYGVTTYDTMDTGRVLQIRDGLAALLADLDGVLDCLSALAREHRDTLMIARTNNLHAQPQTFGLKLATWIEELRRHRDRLNEARPRVLMVQFGGAVGTLAALGDKALDFRHAVAIELGLAAPLSNWHNARDGMAEVALALGNLCATLARNARNINALSGSDIGELSEAGGKGRGRSTTMPHKRNPRAAEFAEAVARLGRQRAMGLIEVVEQDHDRNGGTYIAEWMLIPEIFLLTSGALHWTLDLLDRLEVHAERMAANVEASHGLILAERFHLALSDKLGKPEARRILDDACARAFADGTPLVEILLSMPDVSGAMDETALRALADPRGYLGAAPDMVDAVLAAETKD